MLPLCRYDELQDPGARGFTLDDGRKLFAVCKDGQVFVYENRCPHLGIDLEWMPDQFLDVENTLIQCATHGALFIIESGECVAGPCQGQRLTPVASTVEAGVVVLVSM